MKLVPEKYLDLLSTETRAFAYLSTIMPDGSPQVTPIWFDIQDGCILFNSAEGRVKDRNIRARTSVALAIADPNNPYRYLQVRGRVVEITSQGAQDHINRLSWKYTGREFYSSGAPAEKRVIYKLLPEHVNGMG